MNLTLPLLNEFMDEILSYYESKELKSQGLIDLIKAIDKDEKFYHIEDKIVWRKKYWLQHENYIAAMRARHEAITKIADARKAALKSIQLKLAEATGMDPDVLLPIALNTLRNRKQLAILLGVDLNDVPDMPEKFTIIKDKISYDL